MATRDVFLFHAIVFYSHKKTDQRGFTVDEVLKYLSGIPTEGSPYSIR